ncbi:glutamine amidotransferase [Ignicoccus islandicus DSM 13165]|uniref:Pyridoxal 5'-phosphate synthase subunit PdxT n=1 Tax=Ignicoccus islandicus DSM 13165 TaxID=940295 RepID=A0A0U3E8N7_9CREN|nr:pyridoxal 5'-phosphate synthase glutaminase subunit PdxT [Ignicoccus islandicus]ALU11726.1 glutamine amidotransferase [Ignicoccus islandicus DSM 13165]
MRAGVLALQGGVVEHLHMLKKAAEKLSINVELIEVRSKSDLEQVDVLVIPGGESTAIYRLSKRLGLIEPLKEKILEGTPTLGTCAGAAALAKQVVDAQSHKEYEPILGVMDVKVIRNYFGRQRESFEADLNINGIGQFRGIFIRAPVIEPLSSSVEVLAKFKDVTVAARQGNVIATSFHPELTSDTRIHQMLFEMVKK